MAFDYVADLAKVVKPDGRSVIYPSLSSHSLSFQRGVQCSPSKNELFR